MASTMRKWAVDVPDHFKFTFKLFREITHNKQLAFNPEDLTLFMQRINGVGDKKGCLLVQFPPSLGVDHIMQLGELLQQITDVNSDEPWKVAIEFRNRSWYNDEVYELIEQYQFSVVIHDIPASTTPLSDDLPGTEVYLRFHGPNGGYRGSYTDDFLYEYASYIKDWQAEGKMVYVYFNNTMGSAVQNLMTLNKYLSAQTED
jgi:uncharacterized protein YecE (DUF72 family)